MGWLVSCLSGQFIPRFWVHLLLWWALGLTCGSAALFVAVSVDCNVVLARPVTGCDSHFSAIVASRVSPLLQYGLHLVLAVLFVHMSRSLMVSPRTHIKRLYNTRGRHLPELVTWLCTGAAITDRVLAVGVKDDRYYVMVVAVASLVLNSLCSSIAADMNLSADDDEYDEDYGDQDHGRTRSGAERQPFLHVRVNQGSGGVRGHRTDTQALLKLVMCFFVHNAIMFLSDAAYFVILLELNSQAPLGGELTRTVSARTPVERLLVLLGIFVMWYRGSQAVFWYRKYNFPHANVMLPRYDGAILRNQRFAARSPEDSGAYE